MKFIYYACALAMLLSTAMADVFKMKDGSSIEGQIIRETETEYVVEIQVTRSIKDERRLEKKDVASIEVAKKDLELFEKIEKMVPAPDALAVDEYKDRIKTTSQFLVAYPKSSKAKAARDILVVLRNELNVLEKGGIKIGGMMVTAEQRKGNAYDIDARVEAIKIQQMIADRQLLAALRAFSDYEEHYKLSQSCAELVPEIRKVISSYAREVYQLLQTYDQRVKNREQGLNQMSQEDRRVSENAIENQKEVLAQRFAAEKAAKIDWVSVHPFCKEALDHTMSYAKQESKRLESVQAKPAVDGGKLFRDLKAELEVTGDEKDRAKLLNDAKRSGMSQKYVDLLQSFKPVAKDPVEPPAETPTK